MFEFISRLFKEKKVEKPVLPVDVHTAPLSEDQLRMVTKTSVSLRPPQVLVASAQSSGKQRSHNEDSLITINALIADGSAELPFGIYIVADGMGGHEHGEIASGIAARATAQYLMSKLYSALMGVHPEPQNESLQEIMEAAVRQAHTAVVREAPGGGTTLTIALMIGEQVTLAHLGDSRAYFLYPDGRMQTMTSDHSVVGRLVEMGQLTEEEALVHPRRHILYRAVGLDEPHRPDIATHLMPHPGTIMLCSDGLWSVVPQLEILRVIKSAANLTDACQKLVEAANDAGGPDNITVVMVQYLA